MTRAVGVANTSRRLSYKEWLCIWLIIVAFAFSWMAPIWPREQALHSIGTIIAFGALAMYRAKHSMRTSDFAALCFFLVLHMVAARWLYSSVPYDVWSRSALNVSIDQIFGFQRNQFDRFVHFAFGVCVSPAIASHFVRLERSSRRAAAARALLWVIALSVAYEWLEWIIAVVLAPADAEAYNGQQGDMFDAHKDMLLAALGSAVYWLKQCRRRPNLGEL